MALDEVAQVLGVDGADLDFGHLTYFEGEEFTILNEFNAGSASLSGVRGEAKAPNQTEPTLGTCMSSDTHVMLSFICLHDIIVVYDQYHEMNVQDKEEKKKKMHFFALLGLFFLLSLLSFFMSFHFWGLELHVVTCFLRLCVLFVCDYVPLWY